MMIMVAFIETVQLFTLLITGLFLIFLLWGLRRKSPVNSNWKPTVSVLVAARNEEDELPKCLDSLSQQSYPEELCEFIIIDDASTDRTADIVREWSRKDSRFKLQPLQDDPRREMGPKKRALNAGFNICNGAIILVTDADCRHHSNWISTIVRQYDDETSAVCGPVRLISSRNFWERLTAFESIINNILNAAVIGAGCALSCFGANFSYRREAFQTLGGFDTGGSSLSGDDDLFLQKLRQAKRRIRFAESPEAVVITGAPSTAKSAWSRKRRHLSAGRRYQAHWIILAGIIYIACLTTVVLAILKLFSAYDGDLIVISWGSFSTLLLLIYIVGSRRFHYYRWIFWAVITAVVFPLVFSIIHPLTLLPAPPWKGRTAITGSAKA